MFLFASGCKCQGGRSSRCPDVPGPLRLQEHRCACPFWTCEYAAGSPICSREPFSLWTAACSSPSAGLWLSSASCLCVDENCCLLQDLRTPFAFHRPTSELETLSPQASLLSTTRSSRQWNLLVYLALLFRLSLAKQ